MLLFWVFYFFCFCLQKQTFIWKAIQQSWRWLPSPGGSQGSSSWPHSCLCYPLKHLDLLVCFVSYCFVLCLDESLLSRHAIIQPHHQSPSATYSFKPSESHQCRLMSAAVNERASHQCRLRSAAAPGFPEDKVSGRNVPFGPFSSPAVALFEEQEFRGAAHFKAAEKPWVRTEVWVSFTTHSKMWFLSQSQSKVRQVKGQCVLRGYKFSRRSFNS